MPVSWAQAGDAVGVYTSYDNFEKKVELKREGTTAPPLVWFSPEKRAEDGSFNGVLSLPVGKYLMRYEVDGEWMCDDNLDIVYSGGNEVFFNTIFTSLTELLNSTTS